MRMIAGDIVACAALAALAGAAAGVDDRVDVPISPEADVQVPIASSFRT